MRPESGPPRNEVLLLRVWSEPRGAEQVWRASLRHSDQLRRVYFQSPESLLTYLRSHFDQVSPEQD